MGGGYISFPQFESWGHVLPLPPVLLGGCACDSILETGSIMQVSD